MLPNRRNTSREWRSVSSERPTLFCTASRIVRPPGWMAQCAISSAFAHPGYDQGRREPLANCRRHPPRKHHIETASANMPGNLIGAIRKNCRREALQSMPTGSLDTRLAEQPSAKIKKKALAPDHPFLANEWCIAPDSKWQLWMMVPNARCDEPVSGVDSGVAAHESDNRPLHRRTEAIMLDHLEIDARSIKAGASRKIRWVMLSLCSAKFR